MSVIASGILSTDSVQGAEIIDPVSGASASDTQGDDIAKWVYSIDSETIDDDGLLSVKVTVKQDLSDLQHPASFSLVRWMVDPSLQSSGTSSQSSSSTTQNTGQ
jgi:hypothetical protein